MQHLKFFPLDSRVVFHFVWLNLLVSNWNRTDIHVVCFGFYFIARNKVARKYKVSKQKIAFRMCASN